MSAERKLGARVSGVQEAWKMIASQEMNCDPVVRHTRRECLVFTGQMLRGVRIRGRRYCPEAGGITNRAYYQMRSALCVMTGDCRVAMV